MCKPLVYLDQNIIGQVANNVLKFRTFDEFTFVYSKEHFSEISRSSEPQKYLAALNEIDAKLLELELDSNLKMTGRAVLREDGTPSQLYSEYIDAISEVPQGNNVFDPLIAWGNGGQDVESLRALPAALDETIGELTKDGYVKGNDVDPSNDSAIQGFEQVIDELLENGSDIIKTRSAFGSNKGNIGNISGDNVIEQIWSIVSKNSGGMTCDEFFGFNPIDKQGYDNWPVYLGIVGCCSIMDILGFKSEKKCRKIDKIPNILSDASHIGMGAFCSLILSFDEKLVERANAIYQYKGIDSVARVYAR